MPTPSHLRKEGSSVQAAVVNTLPPSVSSSRPRDWTALLRGAWHRRCLFCVEHGSHRHVALTVQEGVGGTARSQAALASSVDFGEAHSP